MTGVQTSLHLTALGDDGALLIAAAPRAGWDAPVPGLDWTVRELVIHVGAVHRWSADIVRRRLDHNETGGSAAFHPDLPDDALVAWYGEGLAALVDTLAGAPEHLVTWSFTPGAAARAAWARRQAHETAIHRVDAEAAAADRITDFETAFAQDGLEELIAGFATMPPFAAPAPATLGLVATDGDSWLVRLDPAGNSAERATRAAATGAHAAVTGSSSDLYRWVWNRDSPAVTSGSPDVLRMWKAVRIS